MRKESSDTYKGLKLKIKKSIYRLRRYALGIGTVGAIAVPAGTQAQPEQTKENTKEQITIQTTEDKFSHDNTLAYGRMVEVNIDEEISERAQWIVDKFIESTYQHLRAIKQATREGKKSRYVKNNFFDVVYPNGGLSGRNNYCITAINRALIDANSCGDLDNVLPEYKKEGNNAVECRRFINYLTQKGFGDCIKKGYLNIQDTEIGDIIMTPRGGGHYHAMTYIGNGKVRSFNNDGEWKLKEQSAVVIRTKEIAKKAIKLELERQDLITGNETGKQIIPLGKAQKIMQILYNGRNADNHVALRLKQNNKTDILFAGNMSANIIAGIKSKREI